MEQTGEQNNDLNALETKALSIKSILNDSGLSNAILVIDFLLGKKITVAGKEYVLDLETKERAERLQTIFSFVESPASKDLLEKIDTNRWLDEDKKSGKDVPVSDWKTPTGIASGKSLYGAAFKDLHALWADRH